MKRTTGMIYIPLGICLGLVLCSDSYVTAAPMCSAGSSSLNDFVSCEAPGQDSLPNVQAALNDAIEPDITLLSTGSFCVMGSCENSEFLGTDPGNGFDISPPDLSSTSITFNQIPAGTQFISLKQGRDFQVFKVPGPTPFVLTHDLNGSNTSHISTFAAIIPEPSTSVLTLLVGLLGTMQRRR